jgi:nitrate/nitrite-specific signal transduction histidine kinase
MTHGDMTTFNRQNHLDTRVFPRGIGWKLRVVFVTLLSLVLIVGGASLYWIQSILVGLEDIEREGLHVDMARSIHSTLQGIISAYVSANLQQEKVSEEHENSLFSKLNADLRRYHESTARPGSIKQIDKIIASVNDISERIKRRTQRSSGLHGETITVADLNALRDAEQRIESIVERLSRRHEKREERRLGQDRQMLGIMLSFYVAFVGLGIFLIVSATFMVRRLIIRPLKSLVQAASEIARGNLSSKVTVSSNDEIGQLSHTFNLMLDQLRDNEERLRGMATLEERGRLAQELHDSLAQELAVLHIELIKAECSLPTIKTADARKMIRAMREIVDRAYEDVRESIFGLRATASDNFDLIRTFPEYLLKFSTLKGIPVDLVVGNPEDVQLAPHAEIQLVRIIHEALSNVSKHAQATRSIVKFERDGKFARITIEDNGRGFTADRGMDKNLHFGLQIMRERAEGVSGKLKIESAPGRGTKVMVYLPLEQRSYDAYPLAVGG